MKVTFKKQWNGNVKGDTGSLPQKMAVRLIEDGVCEATAEVKKGKKEEAAK